MKIKEKLKDSLKVLILLLDEAAVLVIVFVVLHFAGVRIPLPVTIILGLVIGVLVLIIHIKVIPSFHWKQITGKEGMIGLQGRVVQPLTPVGTVYIKDENWKARTDGDYMEIDEKVEVIGIAGLILTVVRSRED
ncbi:NfeD family protein [Chloroflexota bacterium]